MSFSLNSKIIKILAQQGYQVNLGIEVEGGFIPRTKEKTTQIYRKLNENLSKMNINSNFIPEFWKNQWEYQSNFTENNFERVVADYKLFLQNIDDIFYPHQVFLEPILKGWDVVKDSDDKSSKNQKEVHVPNSIQVNFSIWRNGKNLFSDKNFAFFIQNMLIFEAQDNLAFFIPDQESLDRIFLAAEFNLHEELSSPTDISGGHTGSIALYQELNKKGKPNGDQDSVGYWHQHARIEFRLASSSKKYCLDDHLSFVLLVVFEAIMTFDNKQEVIQDRSSYQIPRFYSSGDDSLLSKYHRSNFLTKKIANIQNQCLTNSIKQFKIDFEKKLMKN